MVEIVSDWLPELGASEQQAPWVADEVARQMSGLPTPLRIGVGGLGKVMSVLPAGTTGRLSGLPGTGEYVRLVRSLATVVYLAEREERP